MPSRFRRYYIYEYVLSSTKVTYLGEQLVILSIFGDIWIDCTYIYTSDWSRSCSEEGPLFEGASPRSLYVKPYPPRPQIGPLALIPTQFDVSQSCISQCSQTQAPKLESNHNFDGIAHGQRRHHDPQRNLLALSRDGDTFRLPDRRALPRQRRGRRRPLRHGAGRDGGPTPATGVPPARVGRGPGHVHVPRRRAAGTVGAGLRHPRRLLPAALQLVRREEAALRRRRRDATDGAREGERGAQGPRVQRSQRVRRRGREQQRGQRQ